MKSLLGWDDRTTTSQAHGQLSPSSGASSACDAVQTCTGTAPCPARARLFMNGHDCEARIRRFTAARSTGPRRAGCRRARPRHGPRTAAERGDYVIEIGDRQGAPSPHSAAASEGHHLERAGVMPKEARFSARACADARQSEMLDCEQSRDDARRTPLCLPVSWANETSRPSSIPSNGAPLQVLASLWPKPTGCRCPAMQCEEHINRGARRVGLTRVCAVHYR